MTTFNTGNPIGSTDARDLSDNAENFDTALGTLDATWTDRLGQVRDSFEGRLAKGSFYRVGTFAAGYTLTNMRQTLEYSGHEYSWVGAFPKTVSAGSTPESTGGIGAGAWIDRSDESLRQQVEFLFRGDHGDYGNAITPILGNDLRKIGPIIKPDAAKTFMNLMVESPVIWWDDVDGLYHMVFTGYGNGSGAMKASICHAKSRDLVSWTTESAPILSGSGVPGSPDEFGGTGPYVIKNNGVYHLYYIGLTDAGYESGVKTLCHATCADINNPMWTRHGTIIGLGALGADSEWRRYAIWHPSVVKKDNIYYLFFNASGTLSITDTPTEKIGYAISSNLYDWTVDDINSPLISTEAGTWKSMIAGDPSVYKQGSFWFMDYFGFDGVGAYDSIAWTTDASFPLGWVELPTPTLLPTRSGRLDDDMAHKPYSYLVGGKKYHYYTAVSGKAGTRCIALAVSEAAVDKITYADTPEVKKIITPNDGYSKVTFSPDGDVGPVFEVVHDALNKKIKIERANANGLVGTKLLEIDGGGTVDGATGVRLYGKTEATQVNTTKNGNTEISHFSKVGDIENAGKNVFCKANNYYDGISDRFMDGAICGAAQLIVEPSGIQVKVSTNTPVTDGVITWKAAIIYSQSTASGFRYDSGWIAVQTSTLYQFPHLLGVTPSDFRVQFATSADGSTIKYQGFGFINGNWKYVNADSANTFINKTIAFVQTGEDLIGCTHMRVLVMK